MGADARVLAAVMAGKLTATACRLLRRGGGTVYPGTIARRADPKLLHKLIRPPLGTVLITGTNGKTTTTGMIVRVLDSAGHRVLTNAAGSNVLDGLVAAAVAGTGLTGHTACDIAVFEVDELWMERAVRELQPRLVVVLNFLRDQLDRSGELETTAIRVGEALRALPPEAQIVANVDDPIVWARCEGVPGVIPVGIEAVEFLLPGLPHSADARSCPRCEAPLDFSRVLLAHCGHYACPAGDFARPSPATAITTLEAPALDALHLTMSDGVVLDVHVGGVYNAYNAVAAYATCRTLGVASKDVSAGLRGFRPKFGRQERLRLHGRDMRMLLAKNPAGFDEVLRTADELGDARVYLIAINDGVADGRDVSWLWDVDFERLARTSRQPLVIASGRRAADLAVRLKYAGLPLERLSVEPEPEAALRRLAGLGEPSTVAMIIPTYTAMLDLRAIAQREGAVDAFWRPPAARQAAK